MNPRNNTNATRHSNSNVSKKSSSRRRIPRRSSVVSKSSYQRDESLSSTYIGDVVVDTELNTELKNQVAEVEVEQIEEPPKNEKKYVPRRLSLYVEDSALNQVTTTTAMMNKFPRVPRRVSTVFIGDVVVE